MKQPSNVSKKEYILLQKVRSNSYYFGCSQGYYLFKVTTNTYLFISSSKKKAK